MRTQADIHALLQRFLPVYLIVLLGMTLAGLPINYYLHDAWKMGDWLIHYSGGFVRRGLTGELALQWSSLTSLDPGLFIVLLQAACYIGFFYFSYQLIKGKYLLKYALLILSPFIFTFQLNDFDGGYRKEILYFAVLAFLACRQQHATPQRFRYTFFIVLPLFSLVILSHEMLALFAPYLLAIYLIDNRLNGKNSLGLSVALLPLALSLLAAMRHHGTTAQVEQIFAALAEHDYAVGAGAITWLSYSMRDGLLETHRLLPNYLLPYSLALSLALVAFLPLRHELRQLFASRLRAGLILLSLLATLALCLIALDWGRFIYMHLVSLFILVALVDTQPAHPQPPPSGQPLSRLLLMLVLAWSLFFRIPHCCGYSVTVEELKRITVMSYLVAPPVRLYRLFVTPEAPH